MSQFFYCLSNYQSPTSSGKSTLILPSISVGSVPQLATDLLIHSSTLNLKKVGRISSDSCWGFFGEEEIEGDDDQQGCTALEVFQNKAGLTVIQQRSPVLKSCKEYFVENLLNWIKKEGFQEVLVLGSLDAGMRTDSEMETPLLHLLASTSSTPILTKLSKSYPLFSPPNPNLSNTSQNSQINSLPKLPSGGLTRRILISASKSKVNAGAILLFCQEGDNRGDAKSLAEVVWSLLDLSSEKIEFVEPPSWFTLFGSPADQSLYG